MASGNKTEPQCVQNHQKFIFRLRIAAVIQLFSVLMCYTAKNETFTWKMNIENNAFTRPNDPEYGVNLDYLMIFLQRTAIAVTNMFAP